MRETLTAPAMERPEENLPAKSGIEKKEKREEGETRNLDFYTTTHMVDDPEHWNQEKFREHVTLLKASGIDFMAYDWSWTRVNPSAGEFDQRQIECYKQAKKIMAEAGMKSPTVIFTVAPDFVKELYEQGKNDQRKKAGFYGAYREYITRVKEALVACGGEKIETFQIFNELNAKMYTFVEPEDIPEMCRITREVFHDYNPDLKLKATLAANSLAEAASKVGQATGIMEYLDRNKEMLRENFDKIAVDYYPGIWHWPLKEAGLGVTDFLFNRNKTKDIFKQTGLLEKIFSELSDWEGTEYEIGEYGLPTNEPWSDEDKQRYAFDVFARALRKVIDKLWQEGKALPKSFGIYESSNRLPRNEGEIKMKKRSLNLWPEHDFGLTGADNEPKEILRGRRPSSKRMLKKLLPGLGALEEKQASGEPQLLRIKKYLNRPFVKADKNK